MERICQARDGEIRRTVFFLNGFLDFRKLDGGILKFFFIGSQQQEDILVDLLFFLHIRTASAEKQRVKIQITVVFELYIEVVHPA